MDTLHNKKVTAVSIVIIAVNHFLDLTILIPKISYTVVYFLTSYLNRQNVSYTLSYSSHYIS